MSKAHEPSDESRRQVETMSGLGLTQANMAAILGIDRNTLMKYYREELDTGVAIANSHVARSLFYNATVGNNVTAQIFWMKTRARWREVDRPEDNDAETPESVEVTISNPDED